MSTQQVVRRALLSVSDKSGLIPLAKELVERDIEIVSTGGTARALRDDGIEVIDVADVTGFPEMMDGRVKTLHPAIHGGILARRNEEEDQQALSAQEITPIDLVVVNLYPFQQTVASGAAPAECVEQIDIGGPALIRAAAKNHNDVAVVTDPTDYDSLVDELAEHGGGTSLDFRRSLAAKAFAHTGAYDTAVAQWFGNEANDSIPDRLLISAQRKQVLRYGENPHQQAALYVADESTGTICGAEQIQGKELSYNNLADAAAAWEQANEFAEPAVAIIKHANPCGVSQQPTLEAAYKAALACDPVSAFGGIVAMNRPLDGATAEAISAVFTELVIAPDISPEARETLAKKTNLRVLLTGSPDKTPGLQIRSISGGFLVQQQDSGAIRREDLQVVTEREPTAQELDDLLFAFKVCKHVKSNAIVYAKDGATVGIGAGQMSRVDSARIAAWKAADAARAANEPQSRTVGSVVASDAFFPFADGLVAAVEAGATAVIQPGGSKRDQEVVDAANAAGIAMVFTGIRHFRH